MITSENLIRDLNQIRTKSPLIHNITNYVVMNNTANALLAIGASPVMAHAIEEAAQMASLASALVLNIGTLEPLWVQGMKIAAEAANQKRTPIIFDPVGAGATAYRTEICKQILDEVKPTIIRANASEIMALVNSNVKTKGVDSTQTSDSALSSAQALAKHTGAVVVISGQTDYITDGDKVVTVTNGNTMMAQVTGMGCTATAIVAAFAAVNSNILEAAAHGMAAMGIAGEIAARKSRGNGSLQVNFLDEMYNLDADTIKSNLKH